MAAESPTDRTASTQTDRAASPAAGRAASLAAGLADERVDHRFKALPRTRRA